MVDGITYIESKTSPKRLLKAKKKTCTLKTILGYFIVDQRPVRIMLRSFCFFHSLFSPHVILLVHVFDGYRITQIFKWPNVSPIATTVFRCVCVWFIRMQYIYRSLPIERMLFSFSICLKAQHPSNAQPEQRQIDIYLLSDAVVVVVLGFFHFSPHTRCNCIIRQKTVLIRHT